jgi:hypothetical protein
VQNCLLNSRPIACILKTTGLAYIVSWKPSYYVRNLAKVLMRSAGEDK